LVELYEEKLIKVVLDGKTRYLNYKGEQVEYRED